EAYAGVAAFMPFAGFSPTAPESLAGARLQRVMLAYSLADPALPPSYASEVLVPLARAWARALGVSDRDIAAPGETALPDLVKEGQGPTNGEANDQATGDDAGPATRDSTVKRLDLRGPNGALHQLVFDHAGHFWPTRAYADPTPMVAEFGLRN